MSEVKKPGMDTVGIPKEQRLKQLTAQLVDVLEELNKIRPIQFLDLDSEYVYNYIGVQECDREGRVYIAISSGYDNLPSRKDNPLRDSRGKEMLPLNSWHFMI